MKNFLPILLFSSFLSCVSPTVSEKRELTFDEFIKTNWHNTNSLVARLGTPSSKDEIVADGKTLRLWRYQFKQTSFEFLIDSSNDQKILEKRYFPAPASTEAGVNHLLREKFAKVQFERSRLNCRHNDELILSNRELGISILTQERTNPKAAVVAYSSPGLFDFWHTENKQRKCKY